MKKIVMPVVLSAVVAVMSSLNAQTLTNPSFELPVNSANASGVAPASFTTTTNGGYFESHGTGVFTGTFGALVPEDGSQFLQLSGAGSSVYQDLGVLDANSTYTLTIAIGKENYSGSIPESLVSLLNGTDLSGTTLGSYDTTAFTFNSDPNGVTQFSDVSFTFTTGASVSGDLTFAIQTITDPYGGNPPGTSAIAFDNVRLTESSTPEPSTWALMLCGLGSFLAFQRLRRQNV